MGKHLIDSGDALNEGQSTTVRVPANLKIRSFVLSLIGQTGSTALPVDDIAHLTVRRQLPGESSHSKIQAADFSIFHRMGRYDRLGDVVWTPGSDGGNVDLEAVVDQFVPTMPDNVLHPFGTDEVKIEIDWKNLGNASSLRYELHAKTDNSAVEQYIRRVGVSDLQMTDGATKTRDTGKNCHRLFLLNKADVIEDNTIDVSEYIGEREEEHFQDQGYSDIERANQKITNIDDSGVMNWITRLQIAQGRRRSEHVNDRVHYELEGSGADNVHVVHDRVDFENAYNQRSARSFASRQQGRSARDPQPANSASVERAVARQ